MDMRNKYKLLVKFAVAFVIIVCNNYITKADHPGLGVTFELGPGNEDANALVDTSERSFSVLMGNIRRLNGVDISSRDLRQSRIHLYESRVFQLSFDSSDLTGADLSETLFDDCSFQRTKLKRTRFGRGMIRANCNFADADIQGASISLSKDQLVATLSYKRRDLKDVTLSGDVSETLFNNCNLSNATMIHCDLTACEFADANLAGATIRGLSYGQLAQSLNYKERDLHDVTLLGSDFRNANFRRFNLGGFKDCNLTGAIFADACFSTQVPDRSNRLYGFDNCEISSAQFYSTRTYQHGTLAPGDRSFFLSRMNLDGWSFKGIDLRGVVFRMCTLNDTDFTDARGGDFTASDMSLDQVKSMWNYREGRLDPPEISLPATLIEQLER